MSVNRTWAELWVFAGCSEEREAVAFFYFDRRVSVIFDHEPGLNLNPTSSFPVPELRFS